jgi:hypothetical protein
MNIIDKAFSGKWIPIEEIREFSYYGFNNRYEWLNNKIKEATARGDRESAVKYQYKLNSLDKDLRAGKGAIGRGLNSLKANAVTAFRKFRGNELDTSEEWGYKGGSRRKEINELRDKWENQNRNE